MDPICLNRKFSVDPLAALRESHFKVPQFLNLRSREPHKKQKKEKIAFNGRSNKQIVVVYCCYTNDRLNDVTDGVDAMIICTCALCLFVAPSFAYNTRTVHTSLSLRALMVTRGLPWSAVTSAI